MTDMKERVSIEEILKNSGLIDDSSLEGCIEERKKTGKALKSILIDRGFITAEKLNQVLDPLTEVLQYDLDKNALREDLVRLIPEPFCRKNRVIAVNRQGPILTVAMSDPMNAFALEDIRFITGFDVKTVRAPENVIDQALDHFFGNPNNNQTSPGSPEETEDDILTLSFSDSGGEGNNEDLSGMSPISQGAEEAPVVKLVWLIIGGAIKAGASDIHLEPVRSGIRVRYRIDGMLVESMNCPLSLSASVISRVKILSRCDIAEKRLPQDGTIDLKYADKTVHIIVSVLPTGTGERIVMRILDKGSLAIDLDRLGFSPGDLERLNQALQQPAGLVLVSGPKGSGTKSTLYSFLVRLNSPETCILTAENPIELSLDGVGQVQVKEELGYTYASALSAFMNQDPDVVMIQELRDSEVAQAAVQAAADSFLVLTSVTADDAAASLVKLTELGVQPTHLGTAARLAVSQRGIRKLCERCKIEYAPSAAQLEKTGILKLDLRETKAGSASGLTLFKRGGCQSCANTGYRGRLLVYEIMEISERIREAILGGAARNEITKIAVEEGMETISQNALRRTVEGQTSLEECLKIRI
jgi:type IV pilus assembly protein PilB